MGKPLKPRQEKLAKALATGLPLAKAAKKAGYTGSASSACETAKNPKVSERVEQLRAVVEQKLELSRQEYLKTAWSRYIELAPDHPVTAKYGEMVAKAQGWNEPDKVELNGGMDIIVRIGGKTQDHS
jgi:phage terminase small subunit